MRRPWRPGPPLAGVSDRGAVTVEAAIALVGLTLVLALVLAGVAAVVDLIRCVDAAREAARLTARGDSHWARTAAANIAPDGADIRVGGEGEGIVVEVSAAAESGLLPGLRLRARAYAVPEPTTLDGS